jgi:predicted DNA-binding transcriptional regulator AlpA
MTAEVGADDRLLSEEELAEQLGVKPSTVKRWRYRTPPVGPRHVPLPGRLIRYRPADVREWLAELANADNT